MMPELATALLLFAVAIVIIVVVIGWPHRIRWTGAPAESEPCKQCNGVGMMMLYGGKLLPIPEHMRTWNTTTSQFQAPLGNAVKCSRCHGTGHVWFRRTGPAV
jgi:hypothetical protein